MPFRVGGPLARKEWVDGDIACALQYVNGEEAFVFKALRTSVPAFVIPLPSVWKYGDKDPTMLQLKAFNCAVAWGDNPPSSRRLMEIADCIIKGCQELLAMKPMPEAQWLALQRRAMPAIDEIKIAGNRIEVIATAEG